MPKKMTSKLVSIAALFSLKTFLLTYGNTKHVV